MVAAGWSISCTYQDFELTFYMPNGAPDPGVRSGGRNRIIPDVRGKKLAAARAAITRRDCTVGPIGREFSRTREEGVRDRPVPARGDRVPGRPEGGAERQQGKAPAALAGS